jgi:hypothetical protein
VRALAWEGLGSIDAEQRKVAAAFLAGVASPPGNAPYRRQVAQKLHAVHQTLREPLPAVQIDAGAARGLFVDQLYAVDERSFYVRGWMRDADAEVTRLVMVSPEGATADILPELARYPRPDVAAFYAEGAAATGASADRTGFLAAFSLDAPSRLGHGWKVEMHNAEGDAVEAPAPEVISDAAATRSAVLNDLAYDLSPDAPFLSQHAEPALSRLVAHRTSREEVTAVHSYGATVPTPDVTVLVPLYKRLDFLEHQLAAFVSDPEMRDVDLVYVLDSPSWPSRRCSWPRAVPHVRRAVPAGAAAAQPRLRRREQRRGELRPRPAAPAAELRRPAGPPGVADRPRRGARPAALRGAVGRKLLYEDDSLQHAGMYFDRPEGSQLWTNGHYFKGLHRSFPPASVERTVPAVTGACLLLATELWNEVGGLCGGFVQGDYEDSDLCLRLLQAGRLNYYVPGASSTTSRASPTRTSSAAPWAGTTPGCRPTCGTSRWPRPCATTAPHRRSSRAPSPRPPGRRCAARAGRRGRGSARRPRWSRVGLPAVAARTARPGLPRRLRRPTAA